MPEPVQRAPGPKDEERHAEWKRRHDAAACPICDAPNADHSSPGEHPQACRTYWGNVCAGFGGSLTCRHCRHQLWEHDERREIVRYANGVLRSHVVNA